MSMTDSEIMALWPENPEEFFGDALVVFARRIISASHAEHWNLIGDLPPTDVPLKLKMSDGSILDGIRPDHIAHRNKGLGYFKVAGVLVELDNELIKGWMYE